MLNVSVECISLVNSCTINQWSSFFEFIYNGCRYLYIQMSDRTIFYAEKSRSIIFGIRIKRASVSVCLRLVTFLSLLVVTCGDVELNPGPNGKTSAPIHASSRPATRQQKLSLSQAVSSPPPLQDAGARPKTKHQGHGHGRHDEVSTDADILT